MFCHVPVKSTVGAASAANVEMTRYRRVRRAHHHAADEYFLGAHGAPYESYASQAHFSIDDNTWYTALVKESRSDLPMM